MHPTHFFPLAFLAASLTNMPTAIMAAESPSPSSMSKQQQQIAAAAAAAAESGIPECAIPCLLKAVQISPCSPTDMVCRCTNPQLSQYATICISQSCPVIEALSAKNATETQCHSLDPSYRPRDKSRTYNIVSCTMMATAFLILVARLLYTSFLQTGGMGLDDFFILITFCFCVPSAVFNVSGLTQYGLGKDIWTLSPETIDHFAQSFFIITVLYFCQVFLLKLSLLFFYLRIFPGRTVRRLLWCTVGVDVAFGVAFIFAVFFQCIPLSFNWTRWRGGGGEEGGSCSNINAIAWANAVISITLDIWMLAVPCSQLTRLRMHWRKKIGVASMFAVGTFVTVISIIRLQSLISFHSSENITWDYWDVCLWSTIEVTAGVICACMPSIRSMFITMGGNKLFSKVSSRFLSSITNGSRGGGSSSLSSSPSGGGCKHCSHCQKKSGKSSSSSPQHSKNLNDSSTPQSSSVRHNYLDTIEMKDKDLWETMRRQSPDEDAASLENGTNDRPPASSHSSSSPFNYRGGMSTETYGMAI